MTQVAMDIAGGRPADQTELEACVAACFDCAQVCTACADACLDEDEVQSLARCIRLNLDCADICETTGLLLSRQRQPDPDILRLTVELCLVAARRCAEECGQHAEKHEHCRLCRDVCRRCEFTCDRLLKVLAKRASGSAAQA